MLGRFQRAAGIDSMLESLLSAHVRCIPTMLPSSDSVYYLGCQLEGASSIPVRSFQSLSHTSILPEKGPQTHRCIPEVLNISSDRQVGNKPITGMLHSWKDTRA